MFTFKRKNSMKLTLMTFSIGFLIFSQYLKSQSDFSALNDQFLSYNLERTQLQKKAMLTLTGWSVLNITAGSIGYFSTSNESRYFNQMNAGWNIVNLGLGVFGYLQAKNEFYDDYDLHQSLESHRKVSNSFLFNGALNVSYITAGFLLREAAKNNIDDEMRFRGWGNSLILQGGFLLAFDMVNFTLHQRNRKRFLDPATLNISVRGNELGMVINF